LRLFGLTIARTSSIEKALNPPSSHRGWWRSILESFPGAWQQNVEVKTADVLTFAAVYACVTLIAGDIGKLRLKLMQRDPHNLWIEVPSPANPVFTRPNRYQTRVKFFEQWMVSKLIHGNAYVLKERDRSGKVVALYVLDPQRVTPLVSDVDGSVFYELARDDLSGVDRENVTVPASEIIHDTMIALHHPLVGVSPISACGLAAVQGLAIQNNTARTFQNGGRPGGILTAPGQINQENADRLKAYWDNNFTGENAGKVAVLGDGLKYEALAMTAEDAQLIEQLKWTSENVCAAFHVPSFKVGAGPTPTYQNAEVLNLLYYSDCLQSLIENIESLLDDGMELGSGLAHEFELDDLMRMDTATRFDVAAKAKGIATLDEQRRRVNLPPVEGGNTIYMQIQDHSLAAIAARDEQLIDQLDNAGSEANDDESSRAMIAATVLRKQLGALPPIALLEKKAAH